MFEMVGTAETVDDKNARDGSPPLMSIGGRIRRPTERYNPSSADKKNEKLESTNQSRVSDKTITVGTSSNWKKATTGTSTHCTNR